MFILKLLDFCLEMTKFLLVGSVFLGIKIRKIWIAGIALCMYMAFLKVENVSGDFLSQVITWFVIIISLFLIDGELKKKFICILKNCFLSAYLDVMAGVLLKILVKRDLGIIDTIIINVMLIFFVTIIYFIKKMYKNRSNKKTNKIFMFIIYSCIIIMGISLFMIVTGLEYAGKYVDHPGFMKLANSLTIISFFSILFLVLILFYLDDTNKNMKKYLETEKLLRQTQKSYYETMLQKEEDTRRFRHDIINHLMCLRELITEEKQALAVDYIENLQNDMIKIQDKCYNIGNLVIDSILNYNIQLLGEDVSVTVVGNCSEEIGIHQVDLCTIISNLTKNAVEELQRQKNGKKFLEINIQTQKSKLKIEISNSTDGENEITGEFLPKTIKEDRIKHGIGLKNVKEAVEKNHGIFQWKSSENRFKVLIVLPIN